MSLRTYPILFFSLISLISLHANEFSPQNSDIAFVQLSFDGVNSFNCGVGTVVLQTKKVLKELNEKYRGTFHSKLYLLTPDYSKNLKEFSLDILKENLLDCKTSGGEVYLLPTENRDHFFGNPEQWEDVCEEGANICKKIINQNTFSVIIAHDTAFAQIPMRLKTLSAMGEITKPYTVLWVPHATSWSYNGHTGNTPGWPERHHWELKALQGATTYGYEVGYIGDSIKRDLTNFPFQLPVSHLFRYQTGIILDRFLEKIPLTKIAHELEKRSIPLDKQLIFSIGRATPLKGQDIVLEVFRHLKPLYPNLHLVILAPESDHMPEFIELLKMRNINEGLNATIIDYFDPDLAYYIYQWPKTVLTALLSRADTQPLTVMEARTNPKNSVVLASNQGGMGLQVSDGQDGFVCEIDELPPIIYSPLPDSKSIQAIVQKAQFILDLSPPKRDEIIQNGKRLIREHYDLRQGIISNLNQLLRNPAIELIANQNTIQHQYDLHSPLFFKILKGGIVNPAIGTWQKDGTPVGVFKAEICEEQTAAKRLGLLDKMKQNGFLHLPTIYKNEEGKFLTKIGDRHYSLIEYLPPDSENGLTYKEILELTGKFHQSSQKIPASFLASSKWEEYNSRAFIFSEYRSLLNDEILRLNEFFTSSEFRQIFDKLPKCLIHGDNNFSNIIQSGKTSYFIDLDSARYDARMLDLASLIRYGHFEDYLNDEDPLITINSTYGKFGGELTSLEKKYFHDLVVFSHIEFMSWALTKLKEAERQNEPSEVAKFQSYVSLYKNQLRRLMRESLRNQ